MKFRYIGDSNMVTVGIAGAQFYKGVINEVPDERLAAQLIGNPAFEEVTADMMPPVTTAILLHAPVQGALHPDPEVDTFIRNKIRKAVDKKDVGEVVSPGDGLGNINRADQYSGNVEALADEEGGVTELSSDSGGEEVATPPASKPAGKSKTVK
jgi:hypothetical protein